jgi:2Fe-2S ferredoxin
MVTITFILRNGSRQTVDSDGEANLMLLAAFSGVPGIDAACGGFCSCGTCHVYVESANALPAPTADELRMLAGTAAKRAGNSRLACQLKLTSELDGLVVRIPDAQ